MSNNVNNVVTACCCRQSSHSTCHAAPGAVPSRADGGCAGQHARPQLPGVQGCGWQARQGAAHAPSMVMFTSLRGFEVGV
eukprot:1161470-Pelagomonas_calceolata.AAC.8